MPAQTILSSVLSLIFAKMGQIYNISIGKYRRDFVAELFRVVLAMRGRVNFTNMARFSRLHEQTFRRHFAKVFDWVSFNLVLVRLRRHPDEQVIGVFDASFLPKSGECTYGLDKFFSSAAGAVRKGLEVSVLGVVTTASQRTFALDATQTPPDLPGKQSEENGCYSRVDFYLEQVLDCLERLEQVTCWVGDGYYAKRKFFDALALRDRHLVTKLRTDANLRYLYTGPKKSGPGAPKQYDGKVYFDRLSGFEAVGVLSDKPHVRILTAKANSPHFRRDLKVVVLVNERDGSYAVLCSTDLGQPAEEVVTFYRLRYKIEFVIRDAKGSSPARSCLLVQQAGLTHCQARSREKIDFHLNMSFATVNLGRLLCQKAGLSLTSYVREAYNRFLVGRLFSQLDLGAEFDLSHPGVQQVIQTGRMDTPPPS
jgi:hypothetical protein